MEFNNYNFLFFTLLIGSLFIIGCDDEMDNTSTTSYDCTFIQDNSTEDGFIDDTERSIMMDCFQNKFTDKDLLDDHLIGEWELIGHGEGWIPTISKPCSYITISDDELVFEFTSAYIDTITTHTWNTEEVSTPSFNYLRLNIEPNLPEWLGLSIFCDEYMYGDATPLDGNMYLYEKVK